MTTESPDLSAPVRILVVDDNADAAETLGELLKMVGYEVRVAGDGAQALAAVQQFLPRIALLDIGLPDMDGYALAQRLRADPLTRGILLVALTGYDRDTERARTLGDPFDEHMVKPVAAEALFALLARLAA